MAFCFTTNAQDSYFYYYKGQKISLTLDRNYLNIITQEEFQPSSILDLGFKDFVLESDHSGNRIQRYAKIQFYSTPNDEMFFKKLNSLKDNQSIIQVGLFFKLGNSNSIGISNYFYVKLKSSNDYILLQNLASEKNIEIVKQVPNMPLWYMLSLNHNANGNTLDASNYFYETGLFDDVDPAFMFNFKPTCTSDPLFGSLWGLNNTSNPNIDINACQAWNLTRGSNVNVAIVDQGIDKTHNDLAANISPLSFNCQSGNSPSGAAGNHGTHVAGTVGAIKNNLFIVGVAPESKLMSVSHSLSLTPNISAELASGISWAWQNGAAVINNSWGDQGGDFFDQLHSSILEDAIINAMTQGRNGKGTVVVFAAGNHGGSGPNIDYPANFHEDILVVGSIDPTGNRSTFVFGLASGYGPQLDVVAPGSDILSTTNDNTTETRSGTSMAAPHVTGIVALVLSINPNLSACQVRSIIEGTSKKIGNYSYSNVSGRPNGTWNNEMGYGLVDAYSAVRAAIPAIIGPSLVCSSAAFELNTVPAGSTVSWTTNNPTGFNINVQTGVASRINNFDGPVLVTAWINGPCVSRSVSKFVWVGRPVSSISGVANPYPGQLYDYTTIDPNTNFAASYLWVVEGGTIYGGGGLSNTSVTVFWHGDGYVQLSSDNACGSSTGILYVYPDVSGGCDPCQIMQTYPNPSSDELTIVLNEDFIKDKNTGKIIPSKINLIDNKLNSVYSATLERLELKIPTYNLQEGQYFLKVRNANGSETRQILIKH